MRRMLLWSFVLLMVPLLLSAQLSMEDRRKLERTYNEGVSQILEMDYLAAISSFNECLSIDETYAPAYLQRGRVKIVLGQEDEAMSDLDLAIRSDSELGEAYFYKGMLLFGSDTSGMDRNYLELAISKGFEIAECHYFLGLGYLLEGNDDKALIHFDKAVRLKDDYAVAYHDRAGIKKRLGDFNGALYDYKAAVNYQPDFPLAYNNMGAVKMTLGDYEGAIADFGTAIEQDPQMALPHNNRGYAFYQLGQLDTAMVDFRKAIEKKDGFLEAKLNLAASFSAKNDLERAVSMLDEVISENPDAGILYLNRGLIRELQGDVIGACEDWGRALELGEETAEAYLKECN